VRRINCVLLSALFGLVMVAPALGQTPAPENECECVPDAITPGGTMAVLNNTASYGRGSTQIKAVGVVLSADERTLGACRPNASTDTFSLRLFMTDDDGDVIVDETRYDLTCNHAVGMESFTVDYDVVNCAGSDAPDRYRGSKGEITVEATTEDGTLVVRRVLKCNQ
jgi:hypothetical protein